MKLFGAFTLLGAVAWYIAPHIPTHSVWTLGCVLFGAFAGIPAMCIIAQNAQKQRLDVYHHEVRQSLQQPTVAIAARPQRYIVVGQATRLPVAIHNQIEVTR